MEQKKELMIIAGAGSIGRAVLAAHIVPNIVGLHVKIIEADEALKKRNEAMEILDAEMMNGADAIKTLVNIKSTMVDFDWLKMVDGLPMRDKKYRMGGNNRRVKKRKKACNGRNARK